MDRPGSYRGNANIQYNRRAHPFASSTAYNGAEGWINNDDQQSIDLNRDSFEDIPISEPSKALTRPALSSRLLSSLSQAQPTAAALTRSKSILHSRAKSLAAFVPKLNTANSSPPSENTGHSNRIFGDLFNGESAPVRLGIPSSSPEKELDESEFVIPYTPMFTEAPRPMRTRTATLDSTTISKAGWFGRKMSSTPPPSISSTPDPLLVMNVNSALFPNGPPDPMSPFAFNDLMLNATTLLLRMQNAYKEKMQYIATIQPELDAQKEEIEEAETRARHLKMQLEEMGRRAQEQDHAVSELSKQLAEVKAKSQEAGNAALTIRTVRNSDDMSETSQRWKRISTNSASDSGFESDGVDRDLESPTFEASTPKSYPTVTLSPVSADEDEDEYDWRSRASKQRPGYTRLHDSHLDIRTVGGTLRQHNASGKSWQTVEMLRNENEDLRRHMNDMRQAIQGCIEFVDMVQI